MTLVTETVQTRIFRALEELDAEPGSISRTARFDELDIDSLDMAELAQLVDDEYGVKIRSADMASLVTVGDVIDLVLARAT